MSQTVTRFQTNIVGLNEAISLYSEGRLAAMPLHAAKTLFGQYYNNISQEQKERLM